MINSRNLSDLLPPCKERAEKFLKLAKDAGIDLIVTSTYRDLESQAALYAQGRTKLGAIVTNARPGQSWHNWRCAFDVVPIRNGKPVWNTTGQDGALWRKVGELGETAGLEWAGRWGSKFREYPHFQYTGGLTIEQVKAGRQVV